jgi:cysteine desulfurase/selenocysteine lyase
MSLTAATAELEFPTLTARGIAYLDSAATSQTPVSVLDAMDDYYREHRASVHRGVYPLAVEATELFEAGRTRAATLVGSTPGETVLTRNATEAINLVAYSWGGENVGEGDLVVVTQMEHHSNLVPWQMLCQRTGAELASVPVDDEGLLDLDALDRLLARGPRLLAVAHVSNVLGTINPIAEIAARAHAVGAVVMVDGSQAVPHLPVDVGAIGADFYAWTAHKAYGPTGIGILHGRRALLESMPPMLGGGHMISRVDELESRYAEPPTRFEAGTSAIAEGVGLAAACDLLTGIGMDAVWEHTREIVGHAAERLSAVPGLRIDGPRDLGVRGALLSFTMDGVHPHDIAEILGREGVCVRAGHHCAQPLMRRLGVGATSRASFALHTTHEDVDRLIDGLDSVRGIFG